ncbi:hypothetical protein [Dyella silvae]|uniref:hypothetical protein n=1 Tax=Dyella silvae TaxID=2994424 RepID=UPI00226486F8|nr:hypothetical protein [Dyella silvae]
MNSVRFFGPYDDRVAAELPEGFVVGTCKGECVITDGSAITGVFRRTGEQRWLDETGNAMTVLVEEVDLDRAALRNWSTGVE